MAKFQPQRDVIDSLTELLARAETGEIQGLLCVTLEPDDVVGQCVAGTVKDDKFKAIGSLDVLRRDLMDGVERLKDRYPKVFKAAIAG